MLGACDRASTGPASVIVDVTGEDFNWHFNYAGDDGLTGTADDRTSLRYLYLPANTDVTLNLHSRDYLYSFALPDFGQSSIAVPDLDHSLKFKTGAPGIYALRGDQFCGFSHKTLMGEVRVVAADPASYAMQ